MRNIRAVDFLSPEIAIGFFNCTEASNKPDLVFPINAVWGPNYGRTDHVLAHNRTDFINKRWIVGKRLWNHTDFAKKNQVYWIEGEVR